MTDAKFNALCNEIERLMDSHHISTFLEACTRVLDEKAEHVAVNWQDDGAAELLRAAAADVANAARTVE